MRNLTAGLLLFLALPLAHAQPYTFFTFDVPGATSTTLSGINNNGDLVGSYVDASGTHAFLRTGNTNTVIEVPGSNPGSTSLAAINNRGDITGTFKDANGSHGFIRSADGRTYTAFDLPPRLGQDYTLPTAINDRGDVVGQGFAGGLIQEAFLRSPDGSIIAIQLGTNTSATGIDNAGRVAGSFRCCGSGGVVRGFIRNPDGTSQIIDAPGISVTRVLGMNNTGQLVGKVGNKTLFVRNPDGTFLTFTTLFENAEPSDISDSGTLVGRYGVPDAWHGFLASPSTAPQRPTIREERGVITAWAYGYSDGIAPGSWIEIYGTGLASTTREWTAADFNGNAAPTSLDGVTVRINGQPAFVSYISPTQINAQVPSTVAPGTGTVTVFANGQSSGAYGVTVRERQPGILTFLPSRVNSRDVVAVFPDGTLVSPDRPAHPGDTVTFFGIGFGPVTPNTPAGQIVVEPGSLGPMEVIVNAIRATVTFAGLAPGYVGLYQFNVVIPQGAARETGLSGIAFYLDGENVDYLTIPIAP